MIFLLWLNSLKSESPHEIKLKVKFSFHVNLKFKMRIKKVAFLIY